MQPGIALQHMTSSASHSPATRPATEKPDSPVDAVITWVDGNDPAHRQKMMKYISKKQQKTSVVTGQDQTRFVESGELFYCIASIRTFAPWVQTIFLVTDHQKPTFCTPEYMCQNRVRIVDHRDIFSSLEFALPTFNSRTIETVLWRIPGLAERFIYFNDDFIILQPVEPEDFFQQDGVVLHGKWEKQVNYDKWRIGLNNIISRFAKSVLGITRSMHLLKQMKSAQRAGYTEKYFRAPHVPHPMRKSTLAAYYENYPEALKQNVRWRFRSLEQFSSIFLANHLEIAAGKAQLKEEKKALMFNPELDFGFSIRRKLRQIERGEARFGCLQAVEKLSESHQKELKAVLEKRLLGSGPAVEHQDKTGH